MTLRVAVVGGGIAGLAFAAAAQRLGLDASVRVYEKDGPPRESEAGLQLGPNATRILQRLGAGPALRAVSARPDTLDFVHGRDGSPLLTVPVRPAYAERFRAEHHTLLRADLRHTLTGLLSADTVHRERRCASVTEELGGARLRFTDGTSERADVVVGADGMRSIVRARDRPEPPLVHSGMAACRAVVPIEALDRRPQASVRIWVGVGRHFLCYPVASGRRLNVVAIVPDDHAYTHTDTDTRAQAHADRTPGATPVVAEDLAREFADWDPAVAALVRAAPAIHRVPLLDREPFAEWSTAHTTLIGDAAHPMLPHQAQGACQAIEDAVTLATMLRAADRRGVPEALRRYAALRAPYTARVQRGSREHGALMHSADGVALLARSRPEDVLDLVADTYGHDAEQQALAASAG
ncbi:FAD-dependent monooxygenase [Streptomyces sp. SID3343]|uniref:FAD-dependent monooxygenase n=1 Tax=Streptomyces sp. SID3343 TaxID=2690260 RepID=UPI00136AE79B|nr:FAD-dependent monooxygenase [Streptomyces sp. SID3343]MYW04986.1 NAD(P)-binding protein [Streptomyces sp. SID3343]